MVAKKKQEKKRAHSSCEAEADEEPYHSVCERERKLDWRSTVRTYTCQSRSEWPSGRAVDWWWDVLSPLLTICRPSVNRNLWPMKRMKRMGWYQKERMAFIVCVAVEMVVINPVVHTCMMQNVSSKHYLFHLLRLGIVLSICFFVDRNLREISRMRMIYWCVLNKDWQI